MSKLLVRYELSQAHATQSQHARTSVGLPALTGLVFLPPIAGSWVCLCCPLAAALHLQQHQVLYLLERSSMRCQAHRPATSTVWVLVPSQSPGLGFLRHSHQPIHRRQHQPNTTILVQIKPCMTHLRTRRPAVVTRFRLGFSGGYLPQILPAVSSISSMHGTDQSTAAPKLPPADTAPRLRSLSFGYHTPLRTYQPCILRHGPASGQTLVRANGASRQSGAAVSQLCSKRQAQASHQTPGWFDVVTQPFRWRSFGRKLRRTPPRRLGGSRVAARRVHERCAIPAHLSSTRSQQADV
jgi:hypothetical protein